MQVVYCHVQNKLRTGFGFLGLMLQHWLGVLQHFQGMQCLHLQEEWIALFSFLYPSAVLGEGAIFLCIVRTHKHSVISQNT